MGSTASGSHRSPATTTTTTTTTTASAQLTLTTIFPTRMIGLGLAAILITDAFFLADFDNVLCSGRFKRTCPCHGLLTEMRETLDEVGSVAGQTRGLSKLSKTSYSIKRVFSYMAGLGF